MGPWADLYSALTVTVTVREFHFLTQIRLANYFTQN